VPKVAEERQVRAEPDSRILGNRCDPDKQQ
jgi:hypothetical protein